MGFWVQKSPANAASIDIDSLSISSSNSSNRQKGVNAEDRWANGVPVAAPQQDTLRERPRAAPFSRRTPKSSQPRQRLSSGSLVTTAQILAVAQQRRRCSVKYLQAMLLNRVLSAPISLCLSLSLAALLSSLRLPSLFPPCVSYGAGGGGPSNGDGAGGGGRSPICFTIDFSGTPFPDSPERETVQPDPRCWKQQLKHPRR